MIRVRPAWRTRGAAMRLTLAVATIGVTVPALVSGGVGAAAAVAVLPSPLPNISPPIPGPSLPAGRPAQPCSFDRLASDEFRLLYALPSEGASDPSRGSVQVGVDQERSCHIYRSYDTHADRSDDSGQTFGESLPKSNQVHSLGSVWMVQDHGYVNDRNGGIYTTGNEGMTWAPSNTGIPGVGFGTGVKQLAVATSSMSVAYAIASTGGETVLYDTTDGGSTWIATAEPAAGLTAVAVDPAQSNHLFVAAALPQPGVYESNNGGTSWHLGTAPPGGVAPTSLVFAHADGPGALFAKVAVNGVEAWWRSVDGAATWKPLLATSGAGTSSALIADPSSGKRMIFASANGGTLTLRSSSDLFSTAPGFRKVSAPNGHWGDIQLVADRAGNYFLQATALTGAEGTDYLYAFRFTAVPIPGPPPLPPPSPSQNCLLHKVPLSATRSQPPSGPTGDGNHISRTEWDFTSGSLAFDGAYLDYTYAQADPYQPDANPITSPNLTNPHGVDIPGVIYRINPVDCQEGPTIQINPADTGGVAQRIYFLTYDPTFKMDNGRVGAILAKGALNGDTKHAPGLAPVYAVDNNGHAQFVMGINCPNDKRPECTAEGTTGNPVSLFSYDFFTGKLWVNWTDGGGDTWNALVSLPDLRKSITPTVGPQGCLYNYFGDDPYANGSPGQIGSFVVGGRGIVYASMEDNITIKRIDSNSCQVLEVKTHQVFEEGMAENDQMACDPLSDPGQPKLWVRDQSANFLRAYPISDGYCPFPDRLTLATPVVSVVQGGVAVACANLFETFGDLGPIPNQDVTISVGSQFIGTAKTDANGRACLPFTAPKAWLGQLTLVASFEGTRGYLAARATGIIDVHGEPPLVPPPPPPPQLPQVRPVPPPPPAPILVQQPGLQPATQAQFQVQQGTQMQPAVAAAEEQRTEVEIQTVDGKRQTLSAVSRRTDDTVVASILLQSLTAVAFGYLFFRRGRSIRRAVKSGVRPARIRRD